MSPSNFGNTGTTFATVPLVTVPLTGKFQRFAPAFVTQLLLIIF